MHVMRGVPDPKTRNQKHLIGQRLLDGVSKRGHDVGVSGERQMRAVLLEGPERRDHRHFADR